MSHKVFVSYASQDTSMVAKTLEKLRKWKVLSIDDEIFIDRKGISAGESFREATRAAIGAADTVLVIWSPAAVESKWVNYELGMADALGKELVIVAPRGMDQKPPIASHSFKLVELPGMFAEKGRPGAG